MAEALQIKNLRHMLRFAEVFVDREIVYAVSRQLSWTHLRSLIYIDDPGNGDSEAFPLISPGRCRAS